MNHLKLDPQLARDCDLMTETDFAWIMLLNNAALPWFIVVPKVTVIEVCDLSAQEQMQLMELSNKMSRYIKQKYPVDKLNIAAIGNVVKQLHLHIIGRFENDYCWPGVVWGHEAPSRYETAEVAQIRDDVILFLNSN